tara:strand:- start:4011 stop:5081 length:1071 start_codon:yes stop_codon:yes gene_type:complete
VQAQKLTKWKKGLVQKNMNPGKAIEMTWSTWHDRLHKTLLDNENLLPNGACLLLSVSGGQDSMALLKLLLDLQRIHKWNLHIWHGNHGWHSQSKQIAKELQNWCEKQNLDFHCDHSTKEKTKTEKSARDWRYSFLKKRADCLSENQTNTACNHILTGHTSSDRAETFIMNLARGSDLAGLTSLREERVFSNNIQLVRPLLNFNRNETAQICKELQLPIWIDPSNKSLEFKRNKIREIIFPILEDMNPGCSLRIASLANRLTHYQEDQKALALLAIEAISSKKGLSRTKLISLPITARSTVLARWLEQMNAPSLSSIKLQTLSKKIDQSKPPGYLEIAKDLKVIWSRTSVQLINRKS